MLECNGLLLLCEGFSSVLIRNRLSFIYCYIRAGEHDCCLKMNRFYGNLLMLQHPIQSTPNADMLTNWSSSFWLGVIHPITPMLSF